MQASEILANCFYPYSKQFSPFRLKFPQNCFYSVACSSIWNYHSHCSVFKVRLPTFVKVRFQYPTFRWVLKSALTELVGQSGLEPPTSRLSVVCSSQLSYWPASSQAPYPSLPPSAKTHSLRCSFTPIQTRFFGL